MCVASSGLYDRGPASAARVLKRLFVDIMGLLASCTMTASELHRARRSHRAKCFIKTTVVGNSADTAQTFLWLLSAPSLAEANRRAGRPLEGKLERTPPPRCSSGFRVDHLSKPKPRASGAVSSRDAGLSRSHCSVPRPPRPSLPPPCLGWEMPPPNFCGKARGTSRLRETRGVGGARRSGARAAQMRVRGLESRGAAPRAPCDFRSPGPRGTRPASSHPTAPALELSRLLALRMSRLSRSNSETDTSRAGQGTGVTGWPGGSRAGPPLGGHFVLLGSERHSRRPADRDSQCGPQRRGGVSQRPRCDAPRAVPFPISPGVVAAARVGFPVSSCALRWGNCSFQYDPSQVS